MEQTPRWSKTSRRQSLFSCFASAACQYRRYTNRMWSLQTHRHSIQVDAFSKVTSCLEIALPNQAIKNSIEIRGEIALCTLICFHLDTWSLAGIRRASRALLSSSKTGLLRLPNYPIPAGGSVPSLSYAVLRCRRDQLRLLLSANGVNYSDGSAMIWTTQTRLSHSFLIKSIK